MPDMYPIAMFHQQCPSKRHGCPVASGTACHVEPGHWLRPINATPMAWQSMASTGHGGSEVSRELWRPCGRVRWSHGLGGMGYGKACRKPWVLFNMFLPASMGVQEEFLQHPSSVSQYREKGHVWGDENEQRPAPTRNTSGACESAVANAYDYWHVWRIYVR